MATVSGAGFLLPGHAWCLGTGAVVAGAAGGAEAEEDGHEDEWHEDKRPDQDAGAMLIALTYVYLGQSLDHQLSTRTVITDRLTAEFHSDADAPSNPRIA